MAFERLLRIDLRADDSEAQHTWATRCARSAGLGGEADAVARRVIEEVRRGGDDALVALTAEFEGRELSTGALELDAARRRAAASRVDPVLAQALRVAADNVLRFHRTQQFESSRLERPGMSLVSRVAPLRRVAVYAPGGTAAYPSSVLMAAIPAKVAGVAQVILLTPRASDVVVLAADLAGVDHIYEVGGAQAIAAAALGTATIARVDKIVGPGNAYVTAAKRQVFGLCDIDGIAGPSEILVIADASADAELVAADLIGQAEHDRLACPVLVTDHEPLAAAVDAELRKQLAELPRRAIAEAALCDHGATVLVSDRASMIAAANAYAPEHLELMVEQPRAMAEAMIRAGAIFVGPWTPEAAGDYTAGPSHVLPTAGAARFGSPLGVWDFLKYTSVLELEAGALREQADAIVRLARAEGLEGHARSVELRLKKDPTSGQV
jgi:histidinol dehydrogenase